MKFFLISIILAGFLPVLALDFDLSTKQIMPNNPLISPERNGMVIRSVADTLPPLKNLSALRKKTPEGPYALFHGRLKADAWKFLSIYSSKDLDLWTVFRTARFFSQSPTSETPELTQVLWDNDLILVPGSGDTIFAQMPQGTAVLIAAPFRPVYFDIQSSTPETRAFIGGVELGPVPQKVRWLQGPWAQIRLEAPGHQSWESFVSASYDQSTLVQQTLKEIPRFADGQLIGAPQELFAHGSRDFHGFEKDMHALVSKGLTPESESQIIAMSDWLDSLKARKYVEYISPKHLSVLPWDSVLGGLPVRMWYGANDFDFGFEGVLPCSFEESFTYDKLLRPNQKSESLKYSGRSRRLAWPSAHSTASLDGALRLTYRNWKASVKANNRNVDRYFALDQLELVLPEKSLIISGEFVPAGYIRTSPDWKDFLKSIAQ